jgi:release factor glutamine methyltransferase
MTTVREELVAAAGSLAEVGCDSPRLDAELLLARVLGTDRAGLVMRSDDEVSGDDRTRYLALMTRRVKREPIAYITGYRDFRRLTLAVDPRVLIPRPETELLVEVGLGLPSGARVADVGTGSGAVALALAAERPDLNVTGIDSSEDALAVARANAGRLSLDVEFVCADLLDDAHGYDAVLANLPYVAAGSRLAPEIALYEPAGALFAGADGLDVVRRLVALAGERGVPFIALEIGFDQAAAVTALLRGARYESVARHRDLAGYNRVVVGRR